MRLYAMEAAFLARLRADRRELLDLARSLGTAQAMREARADLMASTLINLSPKAGQPVKLEVRDGVAHIPIVGELTPHAETDACGAYTAEALTEYGYIIAAAEAADADPAVTAIALDINSPGGYVAGVDEAAQALTAISKPTTAYVSDMAASAAYWLAAQADRIVALSPTSRVGSVGVACEEYDDRDALARDGIAHRVYTSTDAPDKRPDTATEEGRSKIVAELDALHAVFVRRVADGRHVPPEKVSKDFGRGGLLTAEAAFSAGMIDEVRGAHLSRPSAGVASSAAVASAAASPTKEVRMDLTTLQAEHPDLYAQVFDLGAKAERTRREKLLTLAVNEAARQSVEASIAAGESFEEASPKAVTAALKGAGGDNPPIVGTAEPALAIPAGLSAKDVSDLKAAGLSDDDIRKHAPKAKE